MAEKNIQRIISKPGVKRDGTLLEGENYVEAQWCRWQRGLPRKMGGYRSVNKYLGDLPRTISAFTQDTLTYVHCGSATKVESLYIDGALNTSVISDRTPTTSYTADSRNMWQFDQIKSTTLGQLIIAQVAPNLNCICNSLGGELFYGTTHGTGALDPITLPTDGDATGGILALAPYLTFFGTDGYFGWSVPNDPTDLSGAGSGAANITSQKIICGKQIRGGSNSPAGVLWSVDSVIIASFVGGSPVFSFNTVSSSSSIMSQQSVVEYDGVFYWVGSDRFLQFNGVVREVDNQMNANYFFDNLNYSKRQKVFGFAVPRFGEIWWCYPHGDSEEPNRAIILNVRENTWYDTDLPNDGRGAAFFPAVFRRPLMTGVTASSDGYKLWIHEVAKDEVDGFNVNPIRSYFETNEIALPTTQGINKGLVVLNIESDFVQSGDITVQIKGRANARAPEVEGPILNIPETASTASEQITNAKEQRRLMRFRFESNSVGGDYQMGHVLAHIAAGDGTMLG